MGGMLFDTAEEAISALSPPNEPLSLEELREMDGEPVWENPKALADLCFSRELQATLFYGQNNLKVRHYLQAGATFYPRWDEEYARRLLKEFGVEEKKRVSQLSKGQLSMVTILIALAIIIPISVFYAGVFGPEAALFSDLFPPDVRYTGISIVYQFPGFLVAGIVPGLCTFLINWNEGDPLYVCLFTLLAAVTSALSAFVIQRKSIAAQRKHGDDAEHI